MIRPEADVFARYGNGDEFVFLLPETDEKGAVALAEKVRLAVAAHNFVYKRTEFPLTLSMGVTQYDPFDTEDMFSVADRCLYAAKATGRDRVVSASKLRANVREMLKATIPIAKEKIMDMFNLEERWFDYFSKDPPSAPLNTTVIYRKEKEK
jgi:predicted signal transduction protein with EAL and GGDEF domain